MVFYWKKFFFKFLYKNHLNIRIFISNEKKFIKGHFWIFYKNTQFSLSKYYKSLNHFLLSLIFTIIFQSIYSPFNTTFSPKLVLTPGRNKFANND